MENKPRYAIVRVDNSCPEYMEDFKCHFPDISIECMSCHHHRYGDTKEQLIRKVAQALIIDEMERYRKAPNCDVNKTIFEHVSRICLEKAQFIVEFLGVEGKGLLKLNK